MVILLKTVSCPVPGPLIKRAETNRAARRLRRRPRSDGVSLSDRVGAVDAARCSVPSSIEKHLPRRLTQKPQVTTRSCSYPRREGRAGFPQIRHGRWSSKLVHRVSLLFLSRARGRARGGRVIRYAVRRCGYVFRAWTIRSMPRAREPLTRTTSPCSMACPRWDNVSSGCRQASDRLADIPAARAPATT